jgi:hypothetical protein
MPHAFVAPRTQAGEGIAGLAMLVDPAFDFRRDVLVPTGTPPGPPASTGIARLVDARPDHLTLEVDAPSGGYLVVLEAYDPGWRATIDGGPATIVAADVLFRGILAPPGMHRVEMTYRPPGLVAGLVISALSLILMAAAAAWTSRAARTHGTEAAP